MKRYPVKLTQEEWEYAVSIGVKMAVMNYYNGCKDKDGLEVDRTWDATIEGMCGEFAFAKLIGVDWDGNLGKYGAVDVAGEIQVKTTATGCLILRDGDPEGFMYVCMFGKSPNFTLMGFMYGHDAKKFPKTDRYKKGRPAHFVEFKYLREFVPPPKQEVSHGQGPKAGR